MLFIIQLNRRVGRRRPRRRYVLIALGLGEHKYAVDDVQTGSDGEEHEHPPAQIGLHVRVALDGDEGDHVAERERDVFAGRVFHGQRGHQGDGAGHAERDQRDERHEAQQLRAEPVKEQSADEIVRADHQAGCQYARGRQYGGRFPVVHGGGHEAARHQEHG